MQTNEQLTNYLLWLSERGITLPSYFEPEQPSGADAAAESFASPATQSAYAFGGERPRILFVGDGGSKRSEQEHGPLPEAESFLLHNIAKALKLTPEAFHYTHYFNVPVGEAPPTDEQARSSRQYFVDTVKRLKPAGVVIMGSHTLNFISGKKLNFDSLRGRVIVPELYGIPTVVTYHLRDMLRFPENKALVWADLNLLSDHVSQQESS